MSGLGLTFLRRGGQAHPTAGSNYILSATRGDQEVYSVLMAKGVSSDGVGITKEDLESKVTENIVNTFKGNTKIVSFDELNYCKKVTSLTDTFADCTNLAKVGLVNIITYSRRLNNGAFYNTSIEEMIMPNLETIGTWGSRGMPMLRRVFIGKKCTSMNPGWAFYQCPLLSTLVILAVTPPPIGNGDMSGTALASGNGRIYVPADSVDAYKAASGWSTWKNSIVPISQLKTDNPAFYNNIEQYL